jgi:hypothetical protein
LRLAGAHIAAYTRRSVVGRNAHGDPGEGSPLFEQQLCRYRGTGDNGVHGPPDDFAGPAFSSFNEDLITHSAEPRRRSLDGLVAHQSWRLRPRQADLVGNGLEDAFNDGPAALLEACRALHCVQRTGGGTGLDAVQGRCRSPRDLFGVAPHDTPAGRQVRRL